MIVRHGRIDLALHRLRAGEGRALLLLHGLGERAPDEVPAAAQDWPGPICALDFTGHGESTAPKSGGYTSEILMGDVDAALEALGEATLVGRGLGAYVALLVAGARPTLVRGAVLADGPGLAGGGHSPGSPALLLPPAGAQGPPDPWALLELSRDIRPPDYAQSYVRLAVQFSGLDTPISVAAAVRPPWLEAVATEPGVLVAPVADALQRYAE
ncbi:MAG: alpha/beta hydrolase [Acidimicrobiia bacterium]|nr:alpha/beta hydrolase [Acidimicrobiia bacterium]